LNHAKKGPGSGLGALIPDLEQPEPAPSEIDIDRIKTNPVQPRLKLDESRLEELAASIRENGILQPVLVRPTRDGYQLVAGERRLAAAQRAGLLRIPAVVREYLTNACSSWHWSKTFSANSSTRSRKPRPATT